MVVDCQIDFDNNEWATYFAGQILTGTVTLKVDRPKQVKAIALKVKGFAVTHWSESKSHHDKKHGASSSTSTSYNGREDYISSLTYLLGSEQSLNTELQPGVHVYNFSCHIPHICPSSFEGTFGHIRYMIKVVLLRPWKFEQTYTKGFTVLKVMDLNYDTPLLKLPSRHEAEKQFGCGPCRSDPFKMNVTLPQTGFVPGQHIPVTVLVNNDSHIKIEDLKIELTMRVIYYSQRPSVHTKSQRIVVSKMKGNSIMKHCNKQFDYQLLVPATPPTCFNLCKIIQIAYQVEVEAKVKGFHANQVICIPVTIGNVPFVDIIQQQPISSSSVIQMRSAPLDDNANSLEDVDLKPIPSRSPQPRPWSANIAPPNYEEAVHVLHGKINEDEAHDYGESDFVPRYPVFNLEPSVPTLEEESDGKGTWL